MFSFIASLFSGIANSIAGYFKLKSSTNRQRREAEKDVAEAEKKAEAVKADIRTAVYTNDDEALNRIVAQILMPIWAIFFASVFAVIGCVSTTPTGAVVYVPTDRRIETCTNSLGIVCKAVPNAVFAELLERAQELKDLKTEMKVDKRVQK